MSFTDQRRHIVTHREINLRWGGIKDKQGFRCSLCGHVFRCGEFFRWQYVTAEDQEPHGCPFVCAKCDTNPKEIADKWRQMDRVAAKRRFF